MQKQNPSNPTFDNRSDVEKSVQQLIVFSIGLNSAEKDELIDKLTSLSDDQLNQLKNVFEEENSRKESLLGSFFAKHPDLYPEFERFSKEHVSLIYQNVEKQEKISEEENIRELLSASF